MDRNDHTFDDDRLLAFALGIEDDPELEAAVADDAVLRDRLTAIRADVDAVARGLDWVVPAPPDDYADLREERWGELRELVTAPPPAVPRRRPFWLRVIAPAAAIGLVLVAGVVGLQQLGVGGADESLTVGTADKGTESTQSRDGAAGSTAEGADSPAVDSVAPAIESTAPDPEAFATIVVARAQTPVSGRQTFVVVRVLKGHAPAKVTLAVTTQAATLDVLHILYLLPKAAGADGLATPSPITGDEYGTAALSFVFRGRPALALPLPVDEDPADVTLP